MHVIGLSEKNTELDSALLYANVCSLIYNYKWFSKEYTNMTDFIFPNGKFQSEFH